MLTTEQRAALKVAVSADPVTAAHLTAGELQALADLMNAAAVPAFTVWKARVSQDEIMLNGFDWARVDNLTVGKARIWQWLFDNAEKLINPSKPNVRAGINQCWVGTAADLAVRAAVYVHCKRDISRFERIFATGVGTSADPGTTAVDGPVSYTDFVGL